MSDIRISLKASYVQWWNSLSLLKKVGPAVFVAVYWLTLHALNGFRSDHLSIGLALLALYYAGGTFKVIFRFFLPVLATGIIYDSQRFYSDYIRGPIRVAEPYQFDKYFFGINVSSPSGLNTAASRLTPNEWFQLHTHPALDLFTGFFYLFFIAIFIGFGAYFVFFRSRTGTPKVSAEQLKLRAPGIMWSFLWLNLLGYSTYYWYAAAPPWYVALYGLGPADLTAQANPAGCIRFDELLGTHFFTGMYGRSADVFGAIPSLHVAYPFLAVFYAHRFGALRGFAWFFYLAMFFSAVYLNHHYVLDVIWGSAYAVIVGVIVERVICRRAEARLLAP